MGQINFEEVIKNDTTGHSKDVYDLVQEHIKIINRYYNTTKFIKQRQLMRIVDGSSLEGGNQTYSNKMDNIIKFAKGKGLDYTNLLELKERMVQNGTINLHTSRYHNDDMTKEEMRLNNLYMNYYMRNLCKTN